MFERTGARLNSLIENNLIIDDDTAKSFEFTDSRLDLEKVNSKYLELQRGGKNIWFNRFKGPEKLLNVSISQFKRGNSFFEKQEYLEAVRCYTLSAAHAGDNMYRLGLAYQRRALCLQKFKFYNAVIMDCDRALASLKKNHTEIDLLIKLKEEAQKLAKPHDFRYHEDIPFYGKKRQHPKIQSARKCLEIEISENQTKRSCVRAATSISQGDIVSVERPYACGNTKFMWYNNCHHCFELCFNMIPCQSCPHAFYCSEKCRDEALHKYHSYECIIRPQLDDLQIDQGQTLAVRTAITGRDEYDEIFNLLRDENSSQSTEKHRSDRLREIMNMGEIPKGISDRDISIAAYTYKILKEHTNFFKNELHEDRFKKIFISLVRSYYFNTIEILEMYRVKDGGHLIQDHELGYGFYSFNRLLDHSCVPNLLRVFYGNVAVLVAIKDIEPGDECTVAYKNCRFTRLEKSIRQKILKAKYNIVCECLPCKDDWPVMAKCEVEDKYKELEALYIQLRKNLGEKPDTKTARKVLQIKDKEFAPLTVIPIFSYFYSLSVLCYMFFGNKNLVVPFPL